MTKDKKKRNENIEDVEIVEETVEEVEEEYNDKEVTVMDMLNRIFICLIIIAIILAINVIVLACKDNTSSSKEETKTEEKTGTSENSNYDVSMMNEVDLKGILDLFESKETYVLYIGRADCSACEAYLPTLQQVQKEYGFKTQYFDINKLNASDTNYDKVLNKLSKKYEMYYQGENRTETFGYWMGFTPMTIIIKDGKQVDGEIGAIDYETLTKMLENNGIKK